MRAAPLLIVLAFTLGLPFGVSAGHIDTSEFRKGCGFTEDQWDEGVYDCAGSIPSIQEPRFRNASEADTWLNEGDLVIGVTNEDEEETVAKAYPIRILNWHEIANDRIGDADIAVTYCPLCGSAIVFERAVDDQVFDFHVSGYLYRQDLVMIDEQTHSLWPQIEGTAAQGDLHGSALTLYGSTTTSWGEWRTQHPDTLVLERPRCDDGSTENQRGCTGNFQRSYGSSPYGNYDMDRSVGISGETREDIHGLHPKDVVIGVRLQDTNKAYPLSLLSSLRVVDDTINDQPVVVAYAGTDAQIFERDADQHFQPGPQAATIQDQQGNRYDAATGASLDQGTDLASIETVDLFWFAWLDHHPQTQLYTENGTVQINDHDPLRGAGGPGTVALLALLGLTGFLANRHRRKQQP